MLNFALNNALQGLSQTLVSLAGPEVEKDNAWTSGGMQNIVHEQYIRRFRRRAQGIGLQYVC
jgi:hypothetical protein